MSEDNDPVPAYFSWRYVLWFLWSNAITILSIAQGGLAALMLADGDPNNPMIPHTVYRWIVLANAFLTGLCAVAKKNNPPGPPPTKS